VLGCACIDPSVQVKMKNGYKSLPVLISEMLPPSLVHQVVNESCFNMLGCYVAWCFVNQSSVNELMIDNPVYNLDTMLTRRILPGKSQLSTNMWISSINHGTSVCLRGFSMNDELSMNILEEGHVLHTVMISDMIQEISSVRHAYADHVKKTIVEETPELFQQILDAKHF